MSSTLYCNKTKDMTDFETLIDKKNIKCAERWSPHSVETYEKNIQTGALCDICKPVLKNIAYSLQYLEFLQLQIEELKLHSIVQTLTYKNYIITATSIIEAIFYSLLKINNKFRKSNWEQITTYKSNPQTVNSKKQYVETAIFQEVTEYDIDMDFDSIIKKVESNKLIKIEHDLFPYIKKMKQLRNRVHLQVYNGNGTNWTEFSKDDYLLVRYVLYKILTSPSFNLDSKKENYYSFISISKQEEEKINIVEDTTNDQP